VIFEETLPVMILIFEGGKKKGITLLSKTPLFDLDFCPKNCPEGGGSEILHSCCTVCSFPSCWTCILFWEMKILFLAGQTWSDIVPKFSLLKNTSLWERREQGREGKWK
jgi:hypothetical protein